MWEFLSIVGVATLIFFAIDMVWLGVISKKLYAKHLGSLMKEKINWTAAIVFYILFILGLSFFVILPAITTANFAFAMMAGAFFGLVCYATYDLTNLATLKGWPLIITGIDLAWGTFICFATSALTYLILI